MYEFLGGKEEGMGTIAEDEADDIDEKPEKMKVYKNGSRKGKPYLRIDNSDSGRKQRRYFTFCTKVAAAERLPDPEKAGGLMQRIIALSCKNGNPKYDISEVINPMGDDNFEELRQELNHAHKLLLIHNLLHHHKKIPDIYTNLKNREKQLYKPMLRIFQGTKTQKTLTEILTNFLNEKRRENTDSLLAFLYQQVKQIVDLKKSDAESKGKTIPSFFVAFSDLWDIITDPLVNPGKESKYKPSSYDSSQFGEFSQKQIGSKLKVLGGKPPKRRGSQRGVIFDEDTMQRLSRMYEEEAIVIETTKSITLDAADGTDSAHSGSIGENQGQQ
jgi:hypothetical protein